MLRGLIAQKTFVGQGFLQEPMVLSEQVSPANLKVCPAFCIIFGIRLSLSVFAARIVANYWLIVIEKLPKNDSRMTIQAATPINGQRNDNFRPTKACPDAYQGRTLHCWDTDYLSGFFSLFSSQGHPEFISGSHTYPPPVSPILRFPPFRIPQSEIRNSPSPFLLCSVSPIQRRSWQSLTLLRILLY